MAKKVGIIFVTVGTALILSALSLFLYNRYEDAQAGQKAESLLVGVLSAMEDQKAQNELSPDLPVVELGGYEYVGVISIPALELKLPVMAEWDYNRLRIAPCRQFGSSRTDDLVIAAHNYKTHFGLLKELSPGDAVTFTDMANIVNDYAVVKTDVLKPNEVDAVQNSGYDLVLYTCTLGGATRVVVFCDRVTDAETASASMTDQQ